MDLSSPWTALVTGANGGLGQAITRTLHGAGANVIVTGRRADALYGIAAETGARTVLADLSSRADVARLAAEAGDVDVLVANAALPATGALFSFSDDEIDRALDVNLRAPIVLARRLAPGMVARRRGQIVFISSIAGKVVSPGGMLYSATKFGLRAFALGLREELRDHDVGVTAVFPGFIRDAGMFAESGVKLPPLFGTRSPEDVGAAVLRAVRKDPAEIDVAAFEQRLGAALGGLSPALVTRAQAALGGRKVGNALADGQRRKR